MPDAMANIDILLNFRLSSAGQFAASPTKVSECFAMDIPTIYTPNVGDLDYYMPLFNAGLPIELSNINEPDYCYSLIQQVLSQRSPIRSLSRPFFDLPIALKSYSDIYSNLLSE